MIPFERRIWSLGMTVVPRPRANVLVPDSRKCKGTRKFLTDTNGTRLVPYALSVNRLRASARVSLSRSSSEYAGEYP